MSILSEYINRGLSAIDLEQVYRPPLSRHDF